MLTEEMTVQMEGCGNTEFKINWLPMMVEHGLQRVLALLLGMRMKTDGQYEIDPESPLTLDVRKRQLNGYVFPHGWSPLHLAGMHDNKPLYDLLVAAGADTTVKDQKGITPPQALENARLNGRHSNNNSNNNNSNNNNSDNNNSNNNNSNNNNSNNNHSNNNHSNDNHSSANDSNNDNGYHLRSKYRKK